MPPSMSAAKAAKDAPQQEGLDPNSCEVALNEGSRDNEKGTGVSAGPGVKSKEKGGSRRKQPNSNKGSASSTSTSTITDDTTKPSGAEPDDANDARAPSRLSDAESVATEPLPQFHFGRTLPQLPTAPFSKVPVLAHCELRELHSASDNNDDNDQGLFATQKLEQGTRIISERPFLTLTAPGDQLDELMLAYESLTKADQEQIWNLRPAAPEASEQLANLRFLTDRLAYDLQNIIFKPTVTRTTVEQGILDEMLPKLQNAMNIWRVAARWHANRCSMTDLPKDQRSSLSQGTPITGLFIKRAHIRHSCVPNCFASFDANVGRMNVHVTRNIAAGEELTLSAFADNMYYSIAADREQELSAWGLTCNCEACDRQHPAFKTHEKSRQRAHTRAVLLSDVLTRLESEELAEEDLNTAQSVLLALVRNLKATGCENTELVRWRNVLVDRILPARALIVPDAEKVIAWQVILKHAVECERLGRVCYGEDREELKVLRMTREGCERAIEMMESAIENEKVEEGEEW